MKITVASSIQTNTTAPSCSFRATPHRITAAAKCTPDSAANAAPFFPITISRRALGNMNSTDAAGPSVPKILNST